MPPQVSWAAQAVGAPKLRSLLLYPAGYPDTTLHTHPHYAVSHEQQLGQSWARFTVFANSSAARCPYRDAAEQVVRLTASTVTELKGSAIPQAAVRPVTEVLAQRGWRCTYSQPCVQFVLPDSQQLAAQEAAAGLPPGYQLGALEQADSALVDSLWSFRSDTSLPMIQQLIASSHTACVRQRDGSLVAWVLEVEPLCAGMLHVLPEHRRQGLAKTVFSRLLSKLQSKCQQRRREHDVADVVGDPSGPAVYSYVVDDNHASLRLMDSLQLQNTGVFTWMGFERTDSRVV